MSVKLRLVVLILFLTLNLEAQEKYTLSGNYKDLSFKDFVTKAESAFDVRIYYSEEWVSGLKTGDYPDCTTLSCLLDNLFQGTSLYYVIEESGNIVITKDFAVKVAVTQTEKETSFLQPGKYFGLAEETQTPGNMFIEMGNPSEKNNPGKVTISGYITNKDTKEPVPGVTVFIKRLSTGTASNEFGYYHLTIPRGAYALQFTSIGMREKMINMNLNGSGDMNIEMSGSITPLKEIIVSADKNQTLHRFEVGAEKINVTSLKLLPTTLGESDILKSVLMIPGIQSVGEGSTGFNVRGGSADQNLVLLYGAPVYNASHFFGFFSAVNSNIIKDVSIYKGGMPGRYGGRISSVIDIGTKEGNRAKFSGNAGISPVTTHLKVEGPIIKDTLSYILTARTTYSNWIFRLLENPALQNSNASFYDLNGRVTYDINKNNKINISAYGSHDSFRFNSDTIYSYDNKIFALEWRHFYSKRFLSTISVNNSYYNYNVSSRSIPAEVFKLSHKVNSSALNADFNWFSGKNEVSFGIDLTRYAISPGSYLPNSDSSLVVPATIADELGWEGAIYAEEKLKLTDYLSVNAGLRVSTFYAMGPQSVLIYDPGFSRSKSTITDTLSFKPGEVISKYPGPELRVSLNFKLSDRNSFKINYNRTRQYLHLLTNSTSISPTDTWKLCDYYLKPQIGDQIAVGFYELLFKNRAEFSAELYYKGIRNIVDFKGGADLIMNENIEKDVAVMKGKAYGLELVFKKVAGKIQYSLGYTYSRTFIKSTGNFPQENINQGEWFPANYDKPNDLIVIFNYLFSRRYSFSSSYIWSTGRPITYPVATYKIYDNMQIHYSDRNKYRVPYYSRLDLSFNISGNLKSNRLAHPNWTFSVYNLLGRENVYSIYFKESEGYVKGYKLSVFGRAIPSVTFSFDF